MNFINYVIDRIEREFAVLYDENSDSIDVNLSSLYSNPKEGDWVYFKNGQYSFNQELTNKMRKRNSDLLKKIMNKE